MDKLHLLCWHDRHGVERPIQSAAAWPKRRREIQASMVEVMGVGLVRELAGPPQVQVLEEVDLGFCRRRKIRYTAESPANQVPAFLFLPAGPGARRAAMLCLLAAFDDRVRVVVTSCGFNSFFKYSGGDLTGWSHVGYMPRIRSVYGCDPKQMPFDFTEVLAAIAPRAVFINAPLRDDNFEVSGVKDCVCAAEPVYRLLGAGTALTVLHPDAAHDFPPEVRQTAYAWLDQQLAR